MNTETTDPRPPHEPPASHLRRTGYAIRTILRVLPALGRNSDHSNPPAGLGFKHFAIAGVICAVALVATIVLLSRIVIGLVLR